MTAVEESAWTTTLRVAVQNYDWDAVAAVVESYVSHVRSSADPPPQDETAEMLGLLRGVRRFDHIQVVADALLGVGPAGALVTRQLAQSLVDSGRPAAARLVYQELLADPETPQDERPEALGGVGRCHKQLYLADLVASRRYGHMRAALEAYREAYRADQRRFWHGINLAALLARAARDGIEVDGVADPAAESGRVAREVLAVVRDATAPGPWALATACEAGVAIGDLDLAVARATMLASHPGADAFILGALLRQLLELWQLDVDELPGQVLVPLLRSAVLGRDGGALVVDPADTRTDRVSALSTYELTTGQPLEKVLGRERFRGMTWWLTGLERCRAVARIEGRFSDPIGTGFLAHGKELSPELPDLVLLTNGHVVPEDLPYADATAVFHGLVADGAAPRRDFRVARWWWYEPSTAPGLDVTILELDAYPADVTPVPLAAQMPRLEAKTPPRAYVIGHPSGMDSPQFSLQDNLLLDYDDRLVHYRSPTEPGSSGSPVFDGSWRLIAVHHAGGLEMPRLHEAGGTYPANEGISVDAIRARLLAEPPRGRRVGEPGGAR